MSQSPNLDLNALWRWVTDQVKAQTNTPALWRSLEAAHPIILVNKEELILGYEDHNSHHAGLLADNRTRNMIEAVLEKGTGVRLRFRTIHGITMADWEAEQRNQVEAVRLQEQTRQQLRARLEQDDNWEAIGERLVRRLTDETPNRGLSSVQGRFLKHAVETLAESYNRLMPETPNETDERNFSRVVDRLGDRLGVSGSLISYLVHTQRPPRGG